MASKVAREGMDWGSDGDRLRPVGTDPDQSAQTPTGQDGTDPDQAQDGTDPDQDNVKTISGKMTRPEDQGASLGYVK